jgi:hypothetical protein
MPGPEEPLLFGGVEEDRRSAGASGDEPLIVAYRSTGRTLDDLPYTDDFDRLHRSLGPAAGTQREVFHRLHNLRKAGKLPKLGKPETRPPRITPEEEDALRALVVEFAGTLGQRDKLPYTPQMDVVVERFNGATGKNLDPHVVWRLVAKLAK